MMRFLSLGTLSVLVVALLSCSTPREEPVPPPKPILTIPSVNPYNRLSDQELNTKYVARLVELQGLNEEMLEANKRRDFGAVNAKAKEGLGVASDAEALAKHLKDPELRAKQLKGIEKIIKDLKQFVALTDQVVKPDRGAGPS